MDYAFTDCVLRKANVRSLPAKAGLGMTRRLMRESVSGR